MRSLSRHLPTIVMVLAFTSFMNARTAQAAALSGSLALVAIGWMIFSWRKAHQTAGDVVLELGRMRPVGPPRMRGWQVLAAFAFVLLGLVMVYGPQDGWHAPARWGMAIMCWGIVGAQLTQLPAGNRLGPAVFAVGFTTGGVLIMIEAWTVLNSGVEAAALTATKWCVFSAFLFIGGIPALIGVLRNGGKTVLYRQGIVGPHGFVSWDDAESLELDSNRVGEAELRVGAYGGWVLCIAVGKDQIESVQQFVANRRAAANDAERPNADT